MFFTINKPPTYEYQMMPKSKNNMVYSSMQTMYTPHLNAGGISEHQQQTRVQVEMGQNDESGRKKERHVVFAENVLSPVEKQIGPQKPSLSTIQNKNMVTVLTHGKEVKVNVAGDASQEKPKVKAMRWGQPTWFLFHTLAEKIKEENFSEHRVELLKTIYLICTALPCPDCTKHATEYMNNINFNAIRTKHDLKMMLYTFHNTVNMRKNYPIFKQEELSQYEKANTLRIIQHFMVNYTPNVTNGLRVDINRYYRQNVAEKLVQWFNKHLYLFDK
jgi:hypothetical protein